MIDGKDEFDGQVEGSDKQQDERLDSAVKNADSSAEPDVYDPAASAVLKAPSSLGKSKAVTETRAASLSATPAAALEKGAIDATELPKAVIVQTSPSGKPGTAFSAADKLIDSDKSEKLIDESSAQPAKAAVPAQVQPPAQGTRIANSDAATGASAPTAPTASDAKPANMLAPDDTAAPTIAAVGGASTSGDQAFTWSMETVTDAKPDSLAQTSSASDTAFFASTEPVAPKEAGSALLSEKRP